MRKLIPAVSLLCALALPAPALAAENDLETRLKEAMASDIRTDAERARDANRKPIETLQFFGLEPDMRVLELVPGGGWYTKLLEHALSADGELYVAIFTDTVAAMVEDGILDDLHVVEVEGERVPSETSNRFKIENLHIPVENIDMVLTFRNMHNFTEEGRRILNEEVFRVLEPGGIYGVVDHTRRHMQADYYENWRRMDPVQMIKEIEAVGFEFVDYSTLHYRPDDELRYELSRATVRGNTDRFTLKFRKPVE